MLCAVEIGAGARAGESLDFFRGGRPSIENQ